MPLSSGLFSDGSPACATSAGPRAANMNGMIRRLKLRILLSFGGFADANHTEIGLGRQPECVSPQTLGAKRVRLFFLHYTREGCKLTGGTDKTLSRKGRAMNSTLRISP